MSIAFKQMKLGVNDQDLDLIFKAIDRSGDGHI
jgi:hypothetical protein